MRKRKSNVEKNKYGYNVNDKGVEIKSYTSVSGNTKIDIYDK